MWDDRGPWYDRLPTLSNCEYEHETDGNYSLIEAWFGILNYRTRYLYHRFLSVAPPA